MAILVAPPAVFEAGTTVAFTQPAVVSAFGAVSVSDGWGVTWHLRRLDGTDDADVVGVADGDGWTVTLTAATSALLTVGGYRWAIRAIKATETVTLSAGTVTVSPNLADTDADVRTWEETTLAVVEAALAGTIEGEVKLYMIAGRQVQTFSPDELMKMRAQLRAQVRAQRSGSAFGSVAVRFCR